MIDLTAKIDNDEALRKLRQLQQTAKQTTSSVVTDADRMDMAMARLGRTLGQIGAGVSLTALVRQVGQVRGEFQKLEIAFSTMLQSEAKATALMSQLTRTAATTPFGLQDVANGAKQLLAYGTSAEKVNETLIRLGDIAAGLSIPLGDLVYLYGTTQTQGRLFTQDLRQFQGRGIPLAEELAKQFKVTSAEVGKLVTAGKVGFPEVEKAIISMTNQGGKFGGLMEAQSKTINGLVSNLEDAFDAMFNEIGQKAEGAFTGVLKASIELVENYEKVIDILVPLVATYGSYRAALIVVAAAQKAHNVVLAEAAIQQSLCAAAGHRLSQGQAMSLARTMLLQKGWKALTASIKASSVAMLTSPVTWITAALAGLSYVIYKVVTAETAQEKAQRKVNEAMDDYKAKQEELKTKAEELHGIMSSDATTAYQQEKAYQELIKTYPELLDKYSKEKILLMDIVALRKEIAGITDTRERATVEANYKKALADYNYYNEEVEIRDDTYGTVMGTGRRDATKAAAALQEAEKWKKQIEEIDRIQAESASTTDKIAAKQSEINKLKEDEKRIDQDIIAAKKRSDANGKAGKIEIYGTSNEDVLQAQKQANINRQKELELEIKNLKEGQNTKKTLSEEELKLAEKRKRIEEELSSLQLDTERRRVSLVENDRERKLLEIETERKNTLLEINKQASEFAKKNREAKITGTNSSGLTKKQQQAIDDARNIADEEYLRSQAKFYEQEAQEMRNYLKEYGTFQEKKLALAEEYAEKISKASSGAERLRLEAKKKQELSNLNAENLRNDIDWATAFGQFGSMFADVIRPTLAKLEEYTATKEFKQMDHASQKEVMDAIARMREATGDSAHLNFEDLGTKVAAYQTALSALHDATEAEAQAYLRLAEAQERYDKALRDGGDGISELDALISAQTDASVASEATKSAERDVENANRGVVDSANGLSEGMNEALESIRGIASGSVKQGITGLADILSMVPGKLGNAFDKVSDKLESVPIIGWILSIIDILKDGLSNLVGSLLDAIFNAVAGILDDILSGDLIKTIVDAIINGIGKIFDAISFGGFSSMIDSINGSNAKETAELIDRLTKSNELLKQSIDDLKDEISNSYGTKTITATQAAIDAQERYNENLRQILDARMGYHNSHHSNAYYWNLQDESLRQINDLLGTSLSDSWADFSKLTAEQMQKIRAYLPEIWNEMINQGKYGERFEDDWNAYADAAGAIEELTSTLHESLTQISFESMRDNFIESLMDMEKSAQDFTDDFAEMFQRALLSYAIGDKFDERLKKWYEDFAKKMEAAKGKLTETQINALRQQYNQMVEEALNERDQIANITGYDKSTDAQSATSRGFQAMSQDTGSELNGRFTDMQGKMAEQLGLSRQAIEQIEYIRGLTEQQLHMQIDTRDILINISSNVSEIRNFSESIPLIHESMTRMNKILDERL